MPSAAPRALARAAEIPDGVLLFLNLNPQSLTHGDLAGDRLLRSVAAAGLEPSQIVLEITERSDARLSQVIADATRLRGLGFRLALDDVGAGNAGLEMLRELSVDFVKIDHTVIAGALDDTHAQAVLLAIIAYAGRAGAYVIAEGIESEQVLAFVNERGGDPPGRRSAHQGRPGVPARSADARDREADRPGAGEGAQPRSPPGHAGRSACAFGSSRSTRRKVPR